MSTPRRAPYAWAIEPLTDLDPRWVEALMRLEYGTLDHLPIRTFRRFARLAEAMEREHPGELERLAGSFGL